MNWVKCGLSLRSGLVAWTPRMKERKTEWGCPSPSPFTQVFALFVGYISISQWNPLSSHYLSYQTFFFNFYFNRFFSLFIFFFLFRALHPSLLFWLSYTTFREKGSCLQFVIMVLKKKSNHKFIAECLIQYIVRNIIKHWKHLKQHFST